MSLAKKSVKTEPEEDKENCVSESDRQAIKQGILSLMVALGDAPARRQLANALELIAEHDFPDKWPTLLPEVKSKLTSAFAAKDIPQLNAMLTVLQSVFRRYCNAYKTDKLLVRRPSSAHFLA